MTTTTAATTDTETKPESIRTYNVIFANGEQLSIRADYIRRESTAVIFYIAGEESAIVFNDRVAAVIGI